MSSLFCETYKARQNYTSTLDREIIRALWKALIAVLRPFGVLSAYFRARLRTLGFFMMHSHLEPRDPKWVQMHSISDEHSNEAVQKIPKNRGARVM